MQFRETFTAFQQRGIVFAFLGYHHYIGQQTTLAKLVVQLFVPNRRVTGGCDKSQDKVNAYTLENTSGTAEIT
jgi:fucose permease